MQLFAIPATVWTTDELGNKSKTPQTNDATTSPPSHIAWLRNSTWSKSTRRPHPFESSTLRSAPIHIKGKHHRTTVLSTQNDEKDWPGIHVVCRPKRHYPKGMVGCDILGYMGSISREQYEGIIHEMKELQTYIKLSEKEKTSPHPMESLHLPTPATGSAISEEKAYSISDDVGKGGIEERFEKHLRGYYGRKCFYSDARGHFSPLRQRTQSPLWPSHHPQHLRRASRNCRTTPHSEWTSPNGQRGSQSMD